MATPSTIHSVSGPSYDAIKQRVVDAYPKTIATSHGNSNAQQGSGVVGHPVAMPMPQDSGPSLLTLIAIGLGGYFLYRYFYKH